METVLELMENVEILSKEEIVESIPPLYGLLPIIFAFVALLGAMLCLWAFAKLSSATCSVGVFIFGAAFTIALEIIFLNVSTHIIIPKFTKDVPTGRYQYEIIIKDDSIFKDIYDNYEILERNGEVYTIQDKPMDSEERR